MGFQPVSFSGDILSSADGKPLLIDRRSGLELFDDFLGLYVAAVPQAQLGWVSVVNGTGGNHSNANAEAGHPGIWNILATGNGGAARAVLYLSLNGIVCPSAKTIFETLVRFPDLSDGTNPYICYLGLSDTQTAGDPVNGANFIYDQATNGNYWECQVMGNSAETSDVMDGAGGASTAAVAANTWYRLGIEIDGISSAKFYVDGVLKYTAATNIPDTGEDFGIVLKFEKTTGATQRSVQVDYMYLAQIFNSKR